MQLTLFSVNQILYDLLFFYMATYTLLLRIKLITIITQLFIKETVIYYPYRQS
jgi:hypothetical protein